MLLVADAQAVGDGDVQLPAAVLDADARMLRLHRRELLLDGGKVVAGGDPAGDGLLLFGSQSHERSFLTTKGHE